MSKNYLHTSGLQIIFVFFQSIILSFTLWSMILLKLIFVMVWGLIYFLCTYLFQHHLEKTFRSLSTCFELKSNWLCVGGSISSNSVLGIDLFVCISSFSTLSWFYRKCWDQIVQILQICSSFSRQFWLFYVLWIFIYILEMAWQFIPKRLPWGSDISKMVVQEFLMLIPSRQQPLEHREAPWHQSWQQFLDMTPQAQATKAKISKWDLNKLKKILQSRRN